MRKLTFNIVALMVAVGWFAMMGILPALAQGGRSAGTRTDIRIQAWVANGQEDSLSLVDVANGEVVQTVPAGINPHILTVSPDGSILYVINAGGHDRGPGAHGATDSSGSGDAIGMEQQASSAGHGNTMDKDSSSTDHGDSEIAADVRGNSLWALDAATGEVLAQVPVGTGPTHPIASPDGALVYVTNTDENSVSVIDTAMWEVIDTIRDLPEPHDGELTPDGRWLYLATAGTNSMTVVDTASRQVVQTFELGKKPRGLVVGGERGEIAYVTNKGDGTLSVINVPDGNIVGTYFVGAGAHAVRVGVDPGIVYVALSEEDTVAVVDAATGDVLSTIAVGDTPEQIDLSSDGRWLFASNNGDATVSIIDLETEEVVSTVLVGQGAYGIQAVSVPAG